MKNFSFQQPPSAKRDKIQTSTQGVSVQHLIWHSKQNQCNFTGTRKGLMPLSLLFF